LLGVVLVASALLLTAACSSDDDKSASSSSSSKSSSSSSSASSSSGSEESLSSQSVPGGGNENGTAGCLGASVAYGRALAAAGAVLAGQGGDLQGSLDQLKGYAAPDSIRDDLQTVVDAYVAYANAIQSSGYTPGQGAPNAAQIQALQDAGDQLNTDDVQSASERVQQYFADNCPG
jgi:hypothetical protein